MDFSSLIKNLPHFSSVLKELPHPALSEDVVIRQLLQHSKFVSFLKHTPFGEILDDPAVRSVLENMRISELLEKIKQVESIPTDPTALPRLMSEFGINVLAAHTPPRPLPFSLYSAVPTTPGKAGPVNDYTSWPGLTDRTFSARHLPPADQAYIDSLPSNSAAQGGVSPTGELFRRGEQQKKGRSSVLFGYFAQWFTDSFLRVNMMDRRKNTSNHEIDLCQIYGLTEETAYILRSKEGGRLSSQVIDGEEYPDSLYEAGADGKPQVRAKYAGLPYVQVDPATGKSLLDWVFATQQLPEERKLGIYATGLERGNSSMGYVSMTVLFLREHNRLAGELQKRNPGWDDERLFQTARMINTVLLLRIVVEDYINHIAGAKRFVFDNSFAEQQDWYRSNWISLEFDMLYRWHGLVPDTVNIDGQHLEPNAFQCNNALLQKIGMAKLIDSAAKQQTGQISLFNTPYFILWTEMKSVQMGRDFRLRSFNEYRERFGLKKLGTWEELTDDPQILGALKKLYPQGIDQLEMIIGLFAEKPQGTALFGDLLNVMVSVDAFTQALTNPLLSTHVFGAQTFTDYGMQVIQDTPSLQSMVDRNVSSGSPVRASFGWQQA